MSEEMIKTLLNGESAYGDDPFFQEVADAIIAKDRRIAELEASIDRNDEWAKGFIEKTEARIAELEAALKPFADYWNTSKVVQISDWKNAYLTLNPQSENEPPGPNYGHDGEEK